jgi:hypothetical protein
MERQIAFNNARETAKTLSKSNSIISTYKKIRNELRGIPCIYCNKYSCIKVRTIKKCSLMWKKEKRTWVKEPIHKIDTDSFKNGDGYKYPF